MTIEDLNNIYNDIQTAIADKNLCLKVCGSYGIYLSNSYLQANSIGNKLTLDKNHNIERFFTDNYTIPRDLDFASLFQYKSSVEKLFLKLGFQRDRRFDTIPGFKRSIFFNKDIKVDVFYDGFDFNHFIDLTIKSSNFSRTKSSSNKQRINIFNTIVPPTELLLQKLQIVKPGIKDLIDTWWILYENEIIDKDFKKNERKGISLPLINFYTSNQWGFYMTIRQNLDRLVSLISSINSNGTSNSDEVKPKINLLLKSIKMHPKSPKWHFRSIIGSKLQWYNDVDDV